MAQPVPLPKEAITAICRRFHVRQLDLVGSAARGGDFDPERSDLDFLVTFEVGHEGPAFGEIFALQEALEAAVGRKVDLIAEGSVRNPFVRASLEQDRVTLHEA